MSTRLRLDRIACDGRGLCTELLPELLTPDPWGYPITLAAEVPPRLLPHARRAAALCPRLALRLDPD